MGAPAEMPHADEALKSLVARFKEDPGSSASTELAAALLARGHASEALRIAEHGLQLRPDDVEGRVERAAALLALGRPRVAYVELKRALAISPANRRALRLLGKSYVDAGAPGRAAELLKQRFQPEEHEPTQVGKAPAVGAPPLQPEAAGGPATARTDAAAGSAAPREGIIPRDDTQPLPRRPQGAAPERPPGTPSTPPQAEAPLAGGLRSAAGAPGGPAPEAARPGTPPGAAASSVAHAATVGPIPALFSDLTRDLGLSDAPPERAASRVEVTQVIRRKRDRLPRSPSELAVIEGPIVDTTQPGQIAENTGDLEGGEASPAGQAVPPLFEASTSPQLALVPALGLDDEPLFQEHMPFAVRPVGEPPSAPEPPSDLRETLDEDAPPELDRALRAALDGAARTTASPPPAARRDGRDTLVDRVEESGRPAETPGFAGPPELGARGSSEEGPAEPGRFEGAARPLLEVSRPSRRAAGAVRLELLDPKLGPRDLALAAAGALLLMIGLAVFFLAAPAAWRSSARATAGGASEAAAQERGAGSGTEAAAGASGDAAGTRAQP